MSAKKLKYPTYENYIRKATIPVCEVIPLIGLSERNLLAGESVKVSQTRLLLFKQKGHKCVACGITAWFFAVEKHNQPGIRSFHLNLYAVSRSGVEIMMTQDHIIPRSKGGGDSLDNLQTMCDRCNFSKGNRWVMKKSWK